MNLSAWVKTHQKQTAAAGAVGAVGLVLFLRSRSKTGGTPSAISTVPVPTSLADTSTTDLQSQLQPQIDALGGQVSGLGNSLTSITDQINQLKTPPTPAPTATVPLPPAPGLVGAASPAGPTPAYFVPGDARNPAGQLLGSGNPNIPVAVPADQLIMIPGGGGQVTASFADQFAHDPPDVQAYLMAMAKAAHGG